MKKNKKTKATLTIQQSIGLQRLGVDVRLASWYETAGSTAPGGCGGQTVTNFPVFTLSDLLTILPRIIDGYELNISADGNEYSVSYILWDRNEDFAYIRHVLTGWQFSAPELIDALYQLLVWVIENGHIMLDKNNVPKT